MRLSHLALSALAIVAWGCDGNMPSRSPGSGVTLGPATLEPALRRTTTSEGIAVANLNASIEASRRRFASKHDLAAASILVEQLLLRATFYGTFDDWDEASTISSVVLEAHPFDSAALLLRARVLNTLHQFDSALEHAQRARAIGASVITQMSAAEIEAQAQHLELTVRLAQNDAVGDVLARRRVLANAAPTYQHVTSLALALAQVGRFEEADAAFRRALEEYRDVSPFPFGWVAFQRGVMWSEQADRPDLGQPLYEEALRYLPEYVLGNVHLAELEALGGEIQSAIDRVEPLVGVTQDPEPLALLAKLEPSTRRARAYETQANAAYEELITRFPEAFLHHAPAANPGPP